MKLHLLVAPLAAAAAATGAAAAATGKNIVFLLTDDQDALLGRSDEYTATGSLEAMPQTQKLLVSAGARLQNAFVSTPICCPSRTEFFTGNYFHNVRMPNGAGGCMHADTSGAADATGLFGSFDGAGYDVGIFGKVTNDQGSMLEALARQTSAYIDSPLDFNDYDGLDYYRAFPNGTNFTETLNETNPVFGTTYQTAQIGNRTLRWLDGDRSKPFFAYVGPHAPHFPAQPAPWHAGAFVDLALPRTPNYNASREGKAAHAAQNPPLSERAACWQAHHFRMRWASLLAVDDVVGALVDRLTTMGVVDDTYFVYASDHGYKQGQWGIGTSKQHPYELDVRIPVIVRGPGIAAGATLSPISTNVDVLPTLLDLAGVAGAGGVDGRSWAGWLRGGSADGWRDRLLVEYESVGTYFNDHSPAWEDGNSTTASCGGPMPRGPEGANTTTCVEGEGVCYFVDSEASNSWRSLRILNESEDTTYVEYDSTWSWNESSVEFYELYDLRVDPYQRRGAPRCTPRSARITRAPGARVRNALIGL